MDNRGRKAQKRKGAGARLYTLRKEMNLTLEEAAKRWKVTKQTLNGYELNRGLFKSDFALRVAEDTGVSLDWLFARADTRAIK